MKKILLLVSAIFFGGTVFAQQTPALELFYGAECPHCHKEIEWLSTLAQQYPDLKIEKYETWHNKDNSKLFAERLKVLGQEPQGVPTNIIGDEVIIGFSAEQKTKILGLIEAAYGEPIEVDLTAEEITDSIVANGFGMSDTKKVIFGFGILLLLVLGGILFTRKND